MNRLVTINLNGLDRAGLPPEQPEAGGPTRMLFLTINALGFKTLAGKLAAATADRDDIDAVHVRIKPTFGMRLIIAQLQVFRGWDMAAYRRLVVWRRVLRRWFRRRLMLNRFDVVHVCTHRYAPAIFDVGGERRPAVAVNIDATAQYGVYGNVSAASLKPLIAQEQRIFSQSDLVFAMSRLAGDSVINDYGIAADRVAILPPSVAPMTPDLPEPPNHDSALVKMVFVGDAFARKGGPGLLRWHQQHLSDLAELHILSSRAKPDRSAKRVFWYNSMPNEQVMSRFLPSMDMLVLPSHDDLSPWVLVEAAVVGLPVIASRVGAVHELTLDGETGLLVPPGDETAFVSTAKKLIGDPALRQRLGVAARQHATEHLNAHRNYNQMLDRLIELTRQRPVD